ncbi:MAG: glycosyltransferase family 4 protein [Chloroflexota bacterium]
MKLLFVADGRSPIAINWIRYFTATGHTVHLASTYPCQPELPLASLTIIPAAFGNVAGGERKQGSSGVRGLLRKLAPVGLRVGLRRRLGPLTLAKAAKNLRVLLDEIQPDVAHAMRIPFEGMMLAQAVLIRGGATPPPTAVSVWGNDFTLHATANATMGFLTRLTLQNLSALHTDCQRDQNLAHAWDFDPRKPEIVLPGNGGIDLDVFDSASRPEEAAPRVINPRGIRAYVRNDTFFAAIPRVLAKWPDAKFVCPNMAGEVQAEKWVRQHGIAHAVELLPHLTRPQMAQQFRRAQVATSISEHDGTPNTLLEAMACGCYPIAGDIESLREWIKPGENGGLVAPGDADALAEAILQALETPALRQSAAAENGQIIRQRAEYGACMASAEAFYGGLIDHPPHVPPIYGSASHLAPP